MLEALSPTASKGFLLRVEATAQLAELRVLQGRLEEAAALLRPYEDRFAACGPLARLHLARGEPHLAAAAIVRALRELVADRLQEGPLLALLVEVELAREDIGAACRAVGRLARVAAGVEGVNLRAQAALAAGRVAAARADHQAALAHLQEAQRLLEGEQPPLLSGLIRLELARVLAEAVGQAAAIGEARAGLSVFERLGARPYADRTAALLRGLGDTEQRRALVPSAAVGSLSPREGEVLHLLRQGLTNAEIAERLFISAKTAEHHVSRVLTKLGVRSRAEAAAVAFTVSSEPLAVSK
jgi:DNA-binding CsgD family transcriptional regulator